MYVIRFVCTMYCDRSTASVANHPESYQSRIALHNYVHPIILPSPSTLRFFLVLLMVIFRVIKVQRILNVGVYFATVVPSADNVRVRLGWDYR